VIQINQLINYIPKYKSQPSTCLTVAKCIRLRKKQAKDMAYILSQQVIATDIHFYDLFSSPSFQTSWSTSWQDYKGSRLEVSTFPRSALYHPRIPKHASIVSLHFCDNPSNALHVVNHQGLLVFLERIYVVSDVSQKYYKGILECDAI
jgi:hypothetical protein